MTIHNPALDTLIAQARQNGVASSGIVSIRKGRRLTFFINGNRCSRADAARRLVVAS